MRNRGSSYDVNVNIPGIDRMLQDIPAAELLYNPFLIYDVGFQYSFLITFGLFLFQPKNLFSLSLDAFLLSLPITLYNKLLHSLLVQHLNNIHNYLDLLDIYILLFL